MLRSTWTSVTLICRLGYHSILWSPLAMYLHKEFITNTFRMIVIIFTLFESLQKIKELVHPVHLWLTEDSLHCNTNNASRVYRLQSFKDVEGISQWNLEFWPCLLLGKYSDECWIFFNVMELVWNLSFTAPCWRIFFTKVKIKNRSLFPLLLKKAVVALLRCRVEKCYGIINT